MYLTGLHKTNTILSRAEQSRAEQSRAEQRLSASLFCAVKCNILKTDERRI